MLQQGADDRPEGPHRGFANSRVLLRTCCTSLSAHAVHDAGTRFVGLLEAMVRGLLRVYGSRVEPGAKLPATFRDRVIEQLMQIQDRGDINLRPRILPSLDLCARLHADAEIKTELEMLAKANPVCSPFMPIPGVGAITAVVVHRD